MTELEQVKAERDALAARVQGMRGLLQWVPMHSKTKPSFGDHVAVLTTDCDDDPIVVMATYNGSGLFLGMGGCKVKPAKGWFSIPVAGWNIPDTSAAILARRDAAIWREAAEVCDAQALYFDKAMMPSTACGAAKCRYALRAKAAAELEKAQ